MRKLDANAHLYECVGHMSWRAAAQDWRRLLSSMHYGRVQEDFLLAAALPPKL